MVPTNLKIFSLRKWMVFLAGSFLCGSLGVAADFGHQSLADDLEIVTTVLTTDPTSLEQHKGPYLCTVISDGSHGQGSTMEEAQLIAGMKCIQNTCTHTGEDLLKSLSGNVSQKVLSVQASPDQAKQVQDMANDEQMRDLLNKTACLRNDRTGALAKIRAYTLCFGVAIQCGKSR